MCPLCEPFHQGIDLSRARDLSHARDLSSARESSRIKPTLLHQVHKRVHAEKKLRSGAALAVADAKVGPGSDPPSGKAQRPRIPRGPVAFGSRQSGAPGPTGVRAVGRARAGGCGGARRAAASPRSSTGRRWRSTISGPSSRMSRRSTVRAASPRLRSTAGVLPQKIVSSWRPVSLRADDMGDGVAVVAAAIARESQLLCFDELQAP
jgi:hypothetical protein